MRKHSFGVVWDFDDVIFDTRRFKEAIGGMLARDGYSKDEVLRTVAIAKDRNGYNPTLHGRMLAPHDPREARRIAAEVRALCRAKAGDFIARDAMRVLRALRAQKVPQYLLSAGTPSFQKIKIESSKLTPFFREVRIVSITEFDGAGDTKIRLMRHFLRKTEPLFFIDDRPKNIAAIAGEASFIGRVFPVFLERKGGEVPRGIISAKRLSMGIFDLRR